MKRSIKQLLSVALVIAMIATLLVAPAAATGTVTAETTYYFSQKAHMDQGSSGSITAVAIEADGLTWSSGFAEQSGHGAHNGDGGTLTVAVPEGKYATLTFTTCAYGNGGTVTAAIGGGTATTLTGVAAAQGETNGDKTDLVYTVVDATGNTVITFEKEVYVHALTVSAFTDEPTATTPDEGGDELTTYTITADATATVKVGETVSVAVSADKGGEVYATTEDTSLITLGAIANGKLPITGKAVGTATVTLGVTDGKGSATIAVEVTEDAATGDFVAVGTYQWVDKKNADNTYGPAAGTGFTFAPDGGKWGFNNGHGPFTANADGDYTLTLTLAAYSNVAIEVCGYSNDGTEEKSHVTFPGIEAVVSDPTMKTNDGGKTLTFAGVPAGDAVFTISKNTYVHGVTVTAPVAEGTYQWVDKKNADNTYGPAAGTGFTFAPDGGKWGFNNSHGPFTANADGTYTITLALAGPANVAIETCGYSNDGTDDKAHVTLGDLEAVMSDPTMKTNDGGKTWTFMNVPAGNAVLGISKNTYVHGVTVNYVVAEGTHQWVDKKNADNTYGPAAGTGFTFAPDGGKWGFNNSHGPFTANEDGTYTLSLVLGGDANVAIETCGYSNNGTADKADVTLPGITATVSDPTMKTNDGGKTLTFKKVPAGKADFTVSKNTYVHGVSVEYITEEVPEVLGNGKVDVWDFGAAKLDEARFNNMLTVDVLKNSAWGDKKAGSFGDAELNGLTWFGGGSTNHRLYTTNADMAGDPMVYGAEGMSDVKAEDPYFKDVEGYDATTAYTGYVYSNNNAQGKTVAEGKVVYIGLDLKAGDKVSIIVSSNGGNSTITFEGPSGVEATALYETCNRKQGEVKTFYAREDGAYKIYSADEKLVVARVYREHPVQLVLTGDVTVPEGKTLPAGLSLTFTNNKSGGVKDAEVKAGETAGTYTYRTVLEAPYDYSVAVKGSKGGFIVETGGTLDLKVPAEGDVAEPHNVGLTQVPLVAVSGTLTGPDAAYVAVHKPVITMTPGADYIYVPEVTVDGLNYSFEAQQGVEYTVGVTMVNDFSGPATEKVKYDAAKADDTIVMTAKPTYDITLTTSPADVDLTNAKITFVNLFEAGKGDETQTIVPYDATQAGKGAYPYTYNFTGATGIKLRDGQYEVMVAGVGAPEQGMTANLKVNGAAATLEVPFDTEIPSVWNFADADFDATDLPVVRGGDGNYKGLILEGNIQKNKTYCLMGNALTDKNTGEVTVTAAKVKIPVKAAGNVVSIEICYSGSGTLGGVDFAANACAGSTSKFDTFTYTATEADAAAGYVEINIADTKAETDANGPQIYLTKVTASTEIYQPTLKVGADKPYKTINAALAAVDKMARTPEQRVTIEIDPGTYEEHVIITANNVTLKNAKAADAKLELKNKGVDIGDNEVRITHYYGTGYNYYSMTPGTFQWSEDTLKASVANGYAATENKGDGKYAGYGYWCASVLVKGSGFEAEGIIFENSFNQYVSKKSTEDTIVPNGKLKEDKSNPRAEMKTVGDTTVQKKAYVERAAAVAITDSADKAYFNHCAIVGRQDALYGDPVRAAFYDCDIYGGTDYIFGPMTAVFAQCDLILNTSETDTDVAYIVAPQQNEGVRGYLMWNCTVTSTVPGVNTASALRSKPGQWGRPWSNTSEAVFYATNVESTLTTVEEGSKVATEGWPPVSLIGGAGWLSGLSSGSKRCVEYDTIEAYTNIDNSAKRDTEMSGGVLTEAKTADGVDITDYKTWMGDWNPLPDGLTVKRQAQDTYIEADKTALEAAVADADTYKVADDVTVMDAGTKPSAVTKGQKFITKDVVDALAKALADAKEILDDPNSTQEQIDAAVKALNDAMANFKVQTGTKGSSVTPPASSGGSRPTTGTDTTTTKTNANGQTVKKTTGSNGDVTYTVTDKDGTVIATVELPASIPATLKRFKDVPANHWAEKSINDLAALGMVKGVSADTYDMTSPVTRGSVATILFRLAQAKGVAADFTDVAADAWYAEAVGWAAKYGVVNGNGDGTFAAEASITREQLATMLYRFAGLLSADTKTAGDLKDFTDAEGVSDWAKDAMAWAVGTGIIKGTDAKELNATDTATRAETACMVDRFIALLK